MARKTKHEETGSMLKVLALTAPLFACMSAAMADTVGWWRFDDGLPGTSSTAVLAATNAVSSTYGTGAYYSITNTGAGTLDTDAAHMPTFVSASYSVYDPISEMYYENKSAVRFARTGTTKSTVEGGAVLIPSSPELKPTSLTIEGFVKTADTPLNTMVPIFGRPLGGSFVSESFALCMLSNGKLFARLRTGVKTYQSDTGGAGTRTINNNAWHHVALTYDASTGTLKVYVDYQEDFTITGPVGNVKYDDGDSLWIGGYRYEGRKLDGRIDEVRLSNVALGPESFLRLKEPASVVIDEDTLIYADFEACLHGDFSERNLNIASADRPMTLRSHGSGMDPAGPTNDVPGRLIYAGTNAACWAASQRSLCFPKSGDACGYSLACPTAAYGANSLTVECFFKCDKAIASDFTENQKIFQIGASDLLLVRTHDGKFYVVFNNCISGSAVWTSLFSGVNDSNLSNGQWHHVAVVYDKAAQTLTFTLDYRFSATQNNVVLDTASRTFRFGSDNTGNAQNFHGAFDSIRVTRRALSRAEFLNVEGSIPECDSTIATMSFEGNYWVGPAPVLQNIASGSGYARAEDGASRPTFTADVPGALIARDGQAMTMLVTNTAALRVEKGYAVYFDVNSLRNEDFTAECFCRVRQGKPNSGIMRINDGSSTSSDPNWALCLDESTNADAAVYDKLKLLFTYVDPATSSKASMTAYYTLPIGLTATRWRHLAVTGERDGEGVLISLYCDYRQVGEPFRVPGPFARESLHPCLAIGASALSNTGLSADFDEVRFSNRKLAPSEFLRVCKKSGVVILFL